MSKTEFIKTIILEALPGANVSVVDPYSDGEHFQAVVVSDLFENQSLVTQHQLVMNALKEAFYTDVHALGLKTFPTTKWELSKHLYPAIKF